MKRNFYINLEGNRYGKLIVLKYSYTKNNKCYWLCECDCGNEKNIRSDSLKSGAITSCSCKIYEVQDLTGMTFDRLTVMSRSEQLNGNTMWNCMCSCGKQTIVSTSKLRGGVKSCGCMLRDYEDMTGKNFNRWTVISLSHIKKRIYMWNCVCECGNKGIVSSSSLKGGQSKSCGCYKIQRTIEYFTKHGESNANESLEYKTWCGIKERCFNVTLKAYKDYGGRGITVCDRWLNSFENFLADMGRKPTPQHSIDRIDNNGNYEPSNCRWATRIEQSRNRRSNVKIFYNGMCKSASEWAEILNIKAGTILGRKKMGWSDDDIITKSVRQQKNKIYE